MSKLKIGFSAFFMLIFLGMFGGLVSAAGFDPTNLQHPTATLNNATIDNNGNTNSQRTHGNFQNNTNSCSNCHSVHNGETDMLLMKSGASELCMSCHDGTLGFYNVTQASEAGIMYSTDNSGSASMHHVDSKLNESAAPGATSIENDTNGTALKNTSTATFECSSCHNPHGSANDRLLNEKVAGNSYAANYNVSIVGYAETITKASDIPTGTPGIKLNLAVDNSTPELQAINNSTQLSGLKIYKSSGIYTAPTGSLTQANVYNYRLNYSAFCGSCHTDYYKSREEGPRALTAADGAHLYTHSTSSTKSGRACTSCHYSHGTDITLLRDTAGKTIADLQKPVVDGGKAWTEDQAKAYMKDVSKTGSNLKRFTNMAVCWSCHQSTHAIANTPGTSTYPASGAIPGGDYSGKSMIK